MKFVHGDEAVWVVHGDEICIWLCFKDIFRFRLACLGVDWVLVFQVLGCSNSFYVVGSIMPTFVASRCIKAVIRWDSGEQVYDHDTFSADDIMGEAEIDIQPLITSATSYGNPEMFGNMQIGKWLKSHDNALMEDSIVNIIDGKVKQDVPLKLQNVECGELYLELEWLPLDQ
ncbi:hypothetical protein Gotur_016147 [Gossypium turneri]